VGAGTAFRQYAMIVCDEAHYLRNRRTATSKYFELLIAGQARRPRMVLLTATPVCNKGAELARLMDLAAPALGGGNTPAPRWADLPHSRLSAEQIRKRCAAPSRLTPAELRELHEEINDLMVRRTRQYVRDACREGIERPAFPVVDSLPVHYELDEHGCHLFAAVLDAATPAANCDPGLEEVMSALRGPVPLCAPLTLAAYAPDSFALDPARIPTWVEFLLALLRSMLLKRIESSPAALAATARNMAERTRAALADLGRGEVAVTICDKRRKEMIEAVRRWMDVGEDELEAGCGEELDAMLSGLLDGRASTGPRGGLPKAVYRPAAFYRAHDLRAALQHDAAVLDDLARRAEQAQMCDPKFTSLIELLGRLRGKAVLFASSRVTSAELTERLEHHLADRPRHHYHGRLASVGRAQPHSARHLTRILGSFCPRTAAPVPAELGQSTPEDLYDLLITTDILAEGVNLQQAGILINYDLPWCPTRLEQRLGRLNRIGSPHAAITAHTFLPDQVLDAWLRLMDTLMKKTKIAATLVGMSTALLPDAPVNIMNFTTLIEQISKPAVTTAPPPLVEMQRARLHQARSHPELKARIAALTPWAGAIHPEPGEDPIVVYCFAVTTNNAGTLPAFARVYGGTRRYGNVAIDTERCLREIEIDPTEWIENRSRQRGQIDGGATAPIESLELVEQLLERARAAVAEVHYVPPPEVGERIHLLAWILRPGISVPTDQRPRTGGRLRTTPRHRSRAPQRF
jgi:Helicase conserved C-terminal domain/SNF2-related domain